MSERAQSRLCHPILIDPNEPLPNGAVVRIGNLRWRCREGVSSVSVSRNCKLVALAANRHIVELVELATAKPMGTLDPGQCCVTTVRFAPDSSLLAAGTYEGPVLIWDVASRERVAALRRYRRPVSALHWVPGTGLLLIGSEHGQVVAWDMRRRRVAYDCRRTIFSTLSLSPCGQHACVYDLYEAVTHPWYGKVTGCGVCVWEAQTGAVSYRLHLPYDWVCCTLAPDGQGVYVVTRGQRGGSDLWLAPRDGKDLQPIAKQLPFSSTMVLSPSGDALALGSDDGRVLVLDVASGRHHEVAQHSRWVKAIEWFADGSGLVSIASDKIISVVWLGRQTDCADVGHRDEIRTLCAAKRGPWCVAASGDGTIRVWHWPTQVERHRMDVLADTVALSPSDKYVAASRRESVYLWEPGREPEIRQIANSPTKWDELMFVPDGSAVLAIEYRQGVVAYVSAGSTCEVAAQKLCEPPPFQGGADVRETIGAACLVPGELWVAYEGGICASYGLPDLRLLRWWRLRSGEQVVDEILSMVCDRPGEYVAYRTAHGVLIAPCRAPEKATALAIDGTPEQVPEEFSPDGRLLVVWEEGGYLLWNLPQRKVAARIEGHPGGSMCATFSGDGKHLLTGGKEGLIIVWEVDQLMATAHRNHA